MNFFWLDVRRLPFYNWTSNSWLGSLYFIWAWTNWIFWTTSENSILILLFNKFSSLVLFITKNILMGRNWGSIRKNNLFKNVIIWLYPAFNYLSFRNPLKIFMILSWPTYSSEILFFFIRTLLLKSVLLGCKNWRLFN